MTIRQLDQKIDKRTKELKKRRRQSTSEWIKGESELIHDIDLLRGVKHKLERLEQELELLKF
jgi:hypothetical protein